SSSRRSAQPASPSTSSTSLPSTPSAKTGSDAVSSGSDAWTIKRSGPFDLAVVTLTRVSAWRAGAAMVVTGWQALRLVREGRRESRCGCGPAFAPPERRGFRKGVFMSDSLSETVRCAVAQHLDVQSTEIRSTHRFERDLGLRPLDVVLIALRLEEVENVELP